MTALAGALVRASDIVVPIYQAKTTSESVTSSTTLQDDNELIVDLEVGTYVLTLFAAAQGATGGDIKIAGSFSGTITSGIKHCQGPALGTTDATSGSMRSSVHNWNSAVPYGTDNAVSSCIVEVHRIVVTVAGTFTVQWAQNASSGTATVMTSSSFLFGWKTD